MRSFLTSTTWKNPLKESPPFIGHETAPKPSSANTGKPTGKKSKNATCASSGVEKKIKAGDSVTPRSVRNLAPGETVPEGEIHSDED